MARRRTFLNFFIYSLALALILLLSGCGGGGGESVTGGDSGGTTSVTLSWDAPTANQDGTDLSDLAGYRVYYGTSPNPAAYATPANVWAPTTTYTTPGLSTGTYYFVVTAFDTSGNESTPSNQASTVIQ